MPLRRFTYVSRVAATIASTDLRHIAGLAEALHRRRDLSGVLAYTGSHFLQVIEGHPEDVGELLKVIRADIRHDAMRVLGDEAVTRRLFDHWYSLHIVSPCLIEEVEAAHATPSVCQQHAHELAQRLLSQLRIDGLMA